MPSTIVYVTACTLMNTGISEKFCSTIQIALARSGSSHGSTSATTTSSSAQRPLWLIQPIAIAVAFKTSSSTIWPMRSGQVGRRVPRLCVRNQNTSPNRK